MKILICSLLGLISLGARAESRFDWITGQHKLVCAAYSPSEFSPVYIQSPESTARPLAGATLTVAYRKSFTETVYLGMTKVDDVTIKDVAGPSKIVVVDDRENNESEFRADYTNETGTVLHMICQRAPGRLNLPL